MARETKVGLLIALCLILLIGIFVSDFLSVSQPEAAMGSPDGLTGFAGGAVTSIDPTPTGLSRPAPPAAMVVGEPRPGLVSGSNGPLPGGWQTISSDPSTPRSAAAAALRGSSEAADAVPGPPPVNRQAEAGARAASVPVPVIPGPDRPAHQTPEPIRPPADAIHYVTARDTLRRIATQYYGSGDYWTTIAAANPGLIGRDGQVRVGDRLVIPDRSSHEAAAALAARLGPSFEAVASEVVVPITTITVQAGDTLSSLASEHLGSADDWRQLMEANADQLDAPELLRAGMSLRLPRGVSAGVSGADAPRVATPAADAASNGRTYTVQTGDNLTRIAARQLGDGGRWRELYEANTAVLSGPDAVVVGQVLRLPE